MIDLTKIIDPVIWQQVSDEIDRADRKHSPFASLHEGYAVLLEEMDELWDEIKKQKPVRTLITFEASQVAASAIRLMQQAQEINDWFKKGLL